jgi:hypothetical protein
MRTVTRTSLLLLLGAALSPAPAAAKGDAPEPGGETRVKIIPKPVPCVPCPCECPEVRPPVASLPPAEEPRQPEPRPPARPSVQPPEPAELRPPPPPPRGTIAGEVLVRDRGGRERGDRSEVVVYIEKMPQKRFAALKRTRRIAQRVAVTRGSQVEFPNEDKFFHNVFSLSEGNTFDLGLYRAGTSKTVTFEKSGVVDVYCNIHPNMWAQVLVLDNPFYAVTGKDGAFEIAKVPPGTYTLVAWISGGEPVKQQVKVEPGGKAQVRFEIKEGTASKPHLNKFNQPYGRYK